ncbi:MAG: hypothetical protein QOF06_1673 [Solirubrobacterales bacterium]|jgi:uncharacterized repeat protein (TIGR01451 family)|nr:hypothetical protein [Solirubrobacterales bacterium]
MRTAEKKSKRFGLLGAFVASVALLLAAAAPASAAGPEWRLDPLAPTSAAPGSTLTYLVPIANVGDAPAEAATEPFTFTAVLPSGLTPVSASPTTPFYPGWDCSSFSTSLTCEDSSDVADPHSPASLGLLVELAVDSGASGVLTSEFQIAGGGAKTVSTVDPTIITPELPEFGIDAFDQRSAADAAGTPSTQAAGRPYDVTTSIDFNSVPDPNPAEPSPLKGSPRPVEATRDVVAGLPPGFVGGAAALGQCSLPDLANGAATSVKSLCPVTSQIGTTLIRLDQSTQLSSFVIPAGSTIGPLPVFNMAPPPDAPARLGFNVAGSIVVIDVTVRSDGDYGLTATASSISEGIAVLGTDLTIWGVPADPVHTPERHCPDQFETSAGFPGCPSTAPQTSFWRNPTTCEAEDTGLAATLAIDSWVHPGDFVSRTIHSHLPNGYPYPESEWGAPQGSTGCPKVLFEPTLQATPTTEAADSPSGLDVHIRVPQYCWQTKDALCQSDLRDAKVTLPPGMTLNPASASGLGACSAGQIGLTTPVGSSSPIHFDESKPSCPDSSKLGNVTIATPLLGRHDAETGEPILDPNGDPVLEPLHGAVYLAKQSDNPFGSLLAMYLVAEGSGVVVKQAGEIVTGPGGRLTTVFKDAPQVPFSDLEVDLFGGPRAPLRTPPTCGEYATRAELAPWSGNATASASSVFEITSCPNSGFDPKLTAGTQNPLAGSYSPFTLRLTREDGTQEIAKLDATLPKGLIGAPKGIAYCPDSVLAAFPAETVLGTGAAEEASPSCPAASQVGTVTVGAGAGPNPFYTGSGRAYLAGPYRGAPLSLAVIAPAVAGPFDLGSVLVRNAIQVDPTSAQLTVASDPLPSILHGIPLDLRDVRVDVDRDHFTLNPTSCDPMQITSTITSTEGASASPSQRFQVAGCERLAFKPRLSLKLKGGTKRSQNPALTAVMRPRVGNANARRIQVALPHSEFLAQNHIRTICTRVQFAADACPKGSIYGRVTATSPILDYSLYGNVYLRSSDHPLPDLVLKLRGPASQPIEIDAVGRIDSKNGGIRTTFEGLPDAPLTKVVLRMQGGAKSLLENSTNICRGTHRATVQMDGQNGKVNDFRPALKADCAGATRRHG